MQEETNLKPEEYAAEQHEIARLKELETFEILDTLPEEDYDNITKIAADICQTPISLVSLVDGARQWFKSHHGTQLEFTAKELAFCAHTIQKSDEPFIINDARKDVRFHDNDLVTGDAQVIFYAGVPLVTNTGHALGTLCVIDNKPNDLSDVQLNALTALSKQVMHILTLRRSKKRLEETISDLKEKNKELERFAFVAAHDIQSPLNNILSLTSTIKTLFKEETPADVLEIITHISHSSKRLKTLVTDLLKYSNSDATLEEQESKFKLLPFLKSIIKLYDSESNTTIKIESKIDDIHTVKTALRHIIINLVSNAIKYNDKSHCEILISVKADTKNYIFNVTDNGPGIPKKEQASVFEVFQVLHTTDKYGRSGSGLGLSIVRKMIRKLNGNIKIKSELGESTSFIFTIQK